MPAASFWPVFASRHRQKTAKSGLSLPGSDRFAHQPGSPEKAAEKTRGIPESGVMQQFLNRSLGV